MGEDAKQLSATPLTAKQRAAQRKSWSIGEMMLEHPEMTRAEAERLYDKVVEQERAWQIFLLGSHGPIS